MIDKRPVFKGVYQPDPLPVYIYIRNFSMLWL
jgi:hypothetical protein